MDKLFKLKFDEIRHLNVNEKHQKKSIRFNLNFKLTIRIISRQLGK